MDTLSQNARSCSSTCRSSTAGGTTVGGLSWRRGTTSLRIILIGIGRGSLAGAATTTLSTFGAVTEVQRALIWLSGSVYHADWTGVGILALWLAVPMALALVSSRHLDLIRVGDTAAHGLGQRVNLVRALMIVLCTLISGAAVAIAGLIGFVGIIVPHAIRLCVGPSYRRILPLSVILGAPFLCLADLLARTVLSPAEIPIGVVTAIAGAPFFLYLLRRNRVLAT